MLSGTIASGASCVLSIEWSSIEDGFVTGRQLCATSQVTVFLIVFTLLVTIILHIKNCLDLSVNLYENLPPEEKGMTDLQINALLYDGARVEMEGVVINSWFDDSAGEKNIELVWINPLREVSFVANGMTPSELRRRLEMEIRFWKMVRNSSYDKE